MMRPMLIPLLLLCLLPAMALAETFDEQCLIFGEAVQPEKARRLWGQALEAWRLGKRTDALHAYEQALIADRRVLRHDDEGMARDLMQTYQEMIKAGASSTALLCRYAFFENVIAGNLEASIEGYHHAARTAATEDLRRQADAEARRLEDQLAYMKRWQEEFQRKQSVLRQRDLALYQRQERISSFDDRIQTLRDELEELDERLAYLSEQEKTTAEDSAVSLQRASRYRRRYYYPEFTPPPTNDPLLQTGYAGPSGAPTPAGSAPTVAASPGLGEAPVPIAPRVRYLERMYHYRNESSSLQNSLSGIRAEITGVQRRMDQIGKEIKDLEKQRDQEQKTPAFAVPLRD